MPLVFLLLNLALLPWAACAALIVVVDDGMGAMVSPNQQNRGNPDCPCIDTSIAFLESSNCVTEDGSAGIFMERGGQGYCYPASNYGSTVCDTHDLAYDPGCSASANSDTSDTSTNYFPAYCYNPFCYVNASQCKMANERFYRSSFSVGDGHREVFDLFYSYSTCNSTAEDWLNFATTDVFNARTNKTLSIAVPISYVPAYWKANATGLPVDSEGEEYYDDSHPFQGWLVDYVNAVVAISNIPMVKFTYKSVGSSLAGSLNPWTRAAYDVKAGISDLATPMWATNDLLEMTPFTVPVRVEKFYLFIEEPEWNTGSLQYNAKKLLLPFSPGLWLAIVACVLLYALLSVLLVPIHAWDGANFPKAKTMEKIKIALRVTIDSTLASWVAFMGGGADYDVEASMAQKLLAFGFSFTTFVAVTAYTANLAAFLTLTGSPSYITTMAEGIAQNVPICIKDAVRTECESMYPQATSLIFYATEQEMFRLYDAGKCKAIVIDWGGVRGVTANAENFCSRALVSTGRSVFERPVAFPANQEIVGGLSYWISEAASRGITYDSFLEQVPVPCNLEMVVEQKGSEDLLQVTPVNMILPLLVFVACCLIAIMSRIASVAGRKKTKKSDRECSIRTDDYGAPGEHSKEGAVTVEAMRALLDDQQRSLIQLLEKWHKDKNKDMRK